MTLRDRMRLKIGTPIDNSDRPGTMNFQERMIAAIRGHIAEIRADKFFGQDDGEWIRQLNNQIRSLQREIAS